MNPTVRGALIGALITLTLCLLFYYFRFAIIEHGTPFFIGVLTTIILLFVIGVVLWIIYKDVIKKRYLGEEPEAKVNSQAFQDTASSFLKKILPNATAEELQNAVKYVQLFIRGRAIYSILGIVIQIFFVLGGLLGTVLFIKQNKLLTSQNKKIDQQNLLFESQNTLVEDQTALLERQNRLFEDQNEKVDAQTKLFTDQNGLFKDQNQLVSGQNRRIDSQIDLMSVQNDRLNLQNNLIEADRRSSLVFLMSNILDKVDEEIREQKTQLGIETVNVSDSVKFELSKPLVNRIVALSRALTPYYRMEGDSLSKKLISPERGQLFIALMENNLDSLTQNTIVANGDFSYAVIGDINLKEAKFKKARLNNADLRGTDFTGAELTRAYLNNADLRYTDFSNANLRYAELHGTDFSGDPGSNRDTDLSNADFTHANLINANLSNTDLINAIFSNARLINATLVNVRLTNANLSHTKLVGADLNEAKLIDADLSYTYLAGIKNITVEQLKLTKTLNECIDLNPTLRAQLEEEKSCLFTEEGCK